jgi:hypothetical protein
MIGERMKASVLIYFAETDRAIAERIRVLLKSAKMTAKLVRDEGDRHYIAHETSGEFCSRPNPFVLGVGEAAEMAVVGTCGRPMRGQIYVQPEIDDAVREIFDDALPRIDLQADDLPRAVAFIRETIGD